MLMLTGTVQLYLLRCEQFHFLILQYTVARMTSHSHKLLEKLLLRIVNVYVGETMEIGVPPPRDPDTDLHRPTCENAPRVRAAPAEPERRKPRTTV